MFAKVLIPINMAESNVESIAQTNVQAFSRANLHPAIKGVLDRLAGAMVAVYGWVKDNLVAQETDEIFMMWSFDHLVMPMTSLV